MSNLFIVLGPGPLISVGPCVFHGLSTFQIHLHDSCPGERRRALGTGMVQTPATTAAEQTQTHLGHGDRAPRPCQAGLPPICQDRGVPRTRDILTKTKRSEATQDKLVSCPPISHIKEKVGLIFLLTLSHADAELQKCMFGADGAGHLFPRGSRCVLGGEWGTVCFPNTLILIYCNLNSKTTRIK